MTCNILTTQKTKVDVPWHLWTSLALVLGRHREPTKDEIEPVFFSPTRCKLPLGPSLRSEPHTIHSKARHDGQCQPSSTMSVLVYAIMS